MNAKLTKHGDKHTYHGPRKKPTRTRNCSLLGVNLIDHIKMHNCINKITTNVNTFPRQTARKAAPFLDFSARSVGLWFFRPKFLPFLFLPLIVLPP